jgi:hypothetical protein
VNGTIGGYIFSSTAVVGEEKHTFRLDERTRYQQNQIFNCVPRLLFAEFERAMIRERVLVGTRANANMLVASPPVVLNRGEVGLVPNGFAV